MTTGRPVSRALAARVPAGGVEFTSRGELLSCPRYDAVEPWDVDDSPTCVLHIAELAVVPALCVDDLDRSEGSSSPHAWTAAHQQRLERSLGADSRLVIGRAQVLEFPRAWLFRQGRPFWDAFDMMDYGPLGSLGSAVDVLEDEAALLNPTCRLVGAVLVLQQVEVLPAFRTHGHARLLVERAVRAVSRSPFDLVVADSQTSHAPSANLLADFKDYLPFPNRLAFLAALGFSQIPVPLAVRLRTERIEAGIGDFGNGTMPCFFRPVRPDTVLEDLAELEEEDAMLDLEDEYEDEDDDLDDTDSPDDVTPGPGAGGGVPPVGPPPDISWN